MFGGFNLECLVEDWKCIIWRNKICSTDDIAVILILFMLLKKWGNSIIELYGCML